MTQSERDAVVSLAHAVRQTAEAVYNLSRNNGSPVNEMACDARDTVNEVLGALDAPCAQCHYVREEHGPDSHVYVPPPHREGPFASPGLRSAPQRKGTEPCARCEKPDDTRASHVATSVDGAGGVVDVERVMDELYRLYDGGSCAEATEQLCKLLRRDVETECTADACRASGEGRHTHDSGDGAARPLGQKGPTDTVPRAEVESALRHMATVAIRSQEWLGAADAVHVAARAAVKAAGYCREEWPGAHTMVDLAEALAALDEGRSTR